MMLIVSPGFTAVFLFLEIADVLVVQIDVDEAAQLALLVVEVRLQPRVLRREIGEQLADGAPSPSTASCLPVNGRSGVGIRILFAIMPYTPARDS
jgi:hypothetical protein